ncbi:hypothetical protein OF83DRAFT_1086761 [Amylostereum chailletii]|nr:hypothetical protein OF83DRAFT_1086761 [Amylostereum chailletii]
MSPSEPTETLWWEVDSFMEDDLAAVSETSSPSPSNLSAISCSSSAHDLSAISRSLTYSTSATDGASSTVELDAEVYLDDVSGHLSRAWEEEDEQEDEVDSMSIEHIIIAPPPSPTLLPYHPPTLQTVWVADEIESIWLDVMQVQAMLEAGPQLAHVSWLFMVDAIAQVVDTVSYLRSRAGLTDE